MPEGDTIAYHALLMRPVLEGRVPDAVETPHPRFGADRWTERLAGREVESVTTHGKNLFIRFAGELVIHSHLRMNGSWGVHPEGRRWKRAPHRAWLVLRSAGHAVVQFDGPVLELLTASRARFDQRLAALGPDVLADEFDAVRYLRRLREDDPTRPFGDALLDQRIVAGLGTVWRAEACHAAALDPWRPTGQVSDEEAVAAIEGVRPRMRDSARRGFEQRGIGVYGRAGRPCPRCGARLRSRGMGDDNRLLYWCAACQA